MYCMNWIETNFTNIQLGEIGSIFRLEVELLVDPFGLVNKLKLYLSCTLAAVLDALKGTVHECSNTSHLIIIIQCA